VFTEEPVFSEFNEIAWEIISPIPNVTVAGLHSSLASSGFAEDQIVLLKGKAG
jgi:hypothetical protein